MPSTTLSRGRVPAGDLSKRVSNKIKELPSSAKPKPSQHELVTKETEDNQKSVKFREFFPKVKDKTFRWEGHFFLGPMGRDVQKVQTPYENIVVLNSRLQDLLIQCQAQLKAYRLNQKVSSDPFTRPRNPDLNVKRQVSGLSKEMQDRWSDFPKSLTLLNGSQQKLIQTDLYLKEKVGVHKLAMFSSGIHDNPSKVSGYIGFLNILFLHDDIRIDSLAPQVYTEKNKGLLTELHLNYMNLYDEVLHSFQPSWSKDTSPAYKALVSHSKQVDSAFGQPFFLGDAIVRFANDVSKLILSLPDGQGQYAEMNMRREVNRYFLACEEEFENKIKGSHASFLKETQADTIQSYLEIRRRNGAVAPCFEYVFLMHGLDIDVTQIPLMQQWQELRTLYVDHICIVNDMQSFPKESTETNPHNLVLILGAFHENLEEGFSISKNYLDSLIQDISTKKQAYFESLKALLIQDVLSTPIESTEISLDHLIEGIDKGSISIKPGQDLFDHIKNAYESILLMEQWADGHIEWEYQMRSKRHDAASA